MLILMLSFLEYLVGGTIYGNKKLLWVVQGTAYGRGYLRCGSIYSCSHLIMIRSNTTTSQWIIEQLSCTHQKWASIACIKGTVKSVDSTWNMQRYVLIRLILDEVIGTPRRGQLHILIKQSIVFNRVFLYNYKYPTTGFV